jgi:hypothetical protein
MKKTPMYIIMLQLLLSSEQILATDIATNTSATHIATSGHSQSATDRNNSGEGAIVTNRLNSSTRPVGSASNDAKASLLLDVYTDGADYKDARASISAGIDSNASCSPCGASINLYDIKQDGNDAISYIEYLGDSHSFTGSVSISGSVSTGILSVSNGDVGFYDVAASIESNLQAAATNTTGVANNATNIATNTAGVATNTAGIATNATNIATNTAGIATNATNIATNTTGIATNKTNIATNTTGIATNKTNIATNTTGIATNKTNIATNTTGIATNKTNIATNTTGIATNKTNIATNTTGIATNKTNIATNTTGIATNKTDIASNTSLIAANKATLSALIGINGAGIQSLASSFTSFQEDTNRNFIALTGNMYEGLAEVTAISNVAYASSGWRASVGYGDYKSKSATAMGISYAGEKYKFKFSKSGDATGFGISYDF